MTVFASSEAYFYLKGLKDAPMPQSVLYSENETQKRDGIFWGAYERRRLMLNWVLAINFEGNLFKDRSFCTCNDWISLSIAAVTFHCPAPAKGGKSSDAVGNKLVQHF